jgi:hypothetical protein
MPAAMPAIPAPTIRTALFSLSVAVVIRCSTY